MGILFGKKKPLSRVTEQDKAILQLKQQRDKLKQYQKRIELALSKDKVLAKKLISNGQKDRAKLLLKKKRFQEQLLLKADGQLENVEKLTHDIEFAQVELQVVQGLKLGNEALKKVNDALNIEDIESILDETREGIEKQNEINALLSGELTAEDEAAVEDELAAIISEEMPDVPQQELDVPEQEPDVKIEEETEEPSSEKKPKREKKVKDKEPVPVLA